MAARTEGLNLHYGEVHAVKDVNFQAAPNSVTALIGPSGCGKSSFLRCLNRMNDRIANTKISGSVEVAGMNPYARGADLLKLRRTVGMLFQKPNPFPATIFENIALAPRLHYGIKGEQLANVVEHSLRKAALWDEVKDIMRRKSAFELSGGQQQRLCLARMLAVQPKVILMDEPCSALDPKSTAKIEELILDLGRDYTVLVVTHNLAQAQRVSTKTGFFMLGELLELGDTSQVFERPQHPLTADYVHGTFG